MYIKIYTYIAASELMMRISVMASKLLALKRSHNNISYTFRRTTCTALKSLACITSINLKNLMGWKMVYIFGTIRRTFSFVQRLRLYILCILCTYKHKARTYIFVLYILHYTFSTLGY